jgi:16S rRNA (guanine(966)-N(2))-methyltransferase RsmD
VLKITSGQHRGRLLDSLPGLKTRPTAERVRQAWMNSLQLQIPEARILDLFSGSGALGFEALSRGAASVCFVEENPKAAQLISKNSAQLNFQDQVTVWNRRAESVLPDLQSGPAFDLVFMDPPYDLGLEDALLLAWPWSQLLLPGGRICVERRFTKNKTPKTFPLKVVRDERYGEAQLTFYEPIL